MDLDEWEFLSHDFSEDRQKRIFQENRNSDSENFLASDYVLWPSQDSRKITEANQALLDPILFESEMGTLSESDEEEEDEEEDDDDDDNGGFNLWRWSSTGIGAICTAAVAATATALCILLLGSQQRNKLQQNQNIRLPIFPDAKGIKEVVEENATKLNEAISAVRDGPMARPNIVSSGYYSL